MERGAVTDVATLIGAILLMTYSNIVMKSRAVINSGPLHSTSVSNYLLAMLCDPIVWSAGVATAAAAIFWVLAIRRVELSVAQPMLASIFVAVPLLAAYFLGEALPPLRIIGLFLIASGVFIVARTA